MVHRGSVLEEIRRGNQDWETFFPALFWIRCKNRFAHLTPDGIHDYQTRKARNIARYAACHAPFFREFYASDRLEDVWSLPTVDKQAMMDHLAAYNTLGLSREEILDFGAHVERTRDFSTRLRGINIGMSSGTSGNKGVEITTRREENYVRAAFFARYPWPGIRVNVAFILRVSSPAFHLNLLGRFQPRWLPRLTYISQLNTMASIRAQLELLEPNVLAAPPSMLRLLADEVEAGRLSLALKQVISYAEVLYPEDRTYLRQVFRCPVYEIYKATEGSIAISCREGSLHINEDLVAVELYNRDGTPTPPGQPSYRMLVTDLHKTSQPIVRYALNDVITIRPGRCACGSAFRVIEQIQGRRDDLFWGARVADGAMQFIFADYIRRAIIFASDHIREYQAVQTAPDAVLVRLELQDPAVGEQTAASVRAAIAGVFAAYGCHPPRIEVVYGPPEPSPHSGKLIRIHRAFEVER